MSQMQQRSLRARVEREDGACVCPKCGAVAEDMHEWMDHVSDEHDVYQEFVSRWNGGGMR